MYHPGMRRPPLRKLAFLLAFASTGAPAATQLAAARLEELSLEQLTEIRVTSVSRREERLVEAPASIYVITAEDIRRSGATDLWGVLRLAPNIYVGRGDNSQWVAGARGMIAGTSNKMLVLVDGRTIYTPLFAGVFSDAQYLPVEDIDRVEVISGPAATLWGSNGVNGVINVMTKSASATPAAGGSAWAGNFERGAYARAVGAIAGEGRFRAYARYRELDERRLESGAPAQDEAERMLAGIRADWEHAAGSTMLEAEAYKGNVDYIGGNRDLEGGHVLGRWIRKSGDANLRVTAYYDRSERVHQGSFGQKLDIADVDVQYAWPVQDRHHVVVGGGYRFARDEIANTEVLGFEPARAEQSWTNAFVQDEWQVRPGFQLTGGIKAERNPYTGVEWLPNLRFGWDVANDHLLWGEVSRSVRAPSRIDRDAFNAVLRTNDTFEAEVAKVVELGYRAQLSPTASFSLTAFHHRYPNLRTLEFTPDMQGVTTANGFEGRVTGLEGWATWRVMPWWRLDAGFTTMSERIGLRSGYSDLGGVGQISNDPRHTAQLRSAWDVGPAWEIDVAVRNVGRIPNYEVPAYTVVDARLGWRVRPGLDVSLAVQNAFDRDYSEIGPAGFRTRFERSWYLLVRWRT
jgi:iron complex outermembrane receptor protein